MELSGTALPVVTSLTMELFAPLGAVLPLGVSGIISESTEVLAEVVRRRA